MKLETWEELVAFGRIHLGLSESELALLSQIELKNLVESYRWKLYFDNIQTARLEMVISNYFSKDASSHVSDYMVPFMIPEELQTMYEEIKSPNEVDLNTFFKKIDNG